MKTLFVCDPNSRKVNNYMIESGEIKEMEVDNPAIFQRGFQYFQIQTSRLFLVGGGNEREPEN